MEDKQKNESMFQKVFGFVFACMGPVLPGMLGTGMVKVILIFWCHAWGGLRRGRRDYNGGGRICTQLPCNERKENVGR